MFLTFNTKTPQFDLKTAEKPLIFQFMKRIQTLDIFNMTAVEINGCRKSCEANL